MSENHLHIVAFDVPYPPNYGGVIDVYYKIKALYNKGIHLHLHIILYPGKDKAPQLEEMCDTVNYYPRETGVLSALHIRPYIVQSRRSPELINNLLKDDYPILFEGLHSCFYIDDPRLAKRKLIYRESNIEHQYYFNLFKATSHLGLKAYFLVESLKLKLFQKVLKHADIMLAVSKSDTEYLSKKFPGKQVVFLPSFHGNDQVTSLEGRGDYFLYHGNLEVPENELAALYLIQKVFSLSTHKLIIAGMNPPASILKQAAKHANIKVIANPAEGEMYNLVREAQANILVTFQASGLKLKLLNTLYSGRFCIVNSTMLNGTGLEELCYISNTPNELINMVDKVSTMEYTRNITLERENLLQQNFSNIVNADRVIGIIFN